ncbi:hypothetical protein [Pasteuria penetrans]|uniref:hypothetical protein n=1 Tax=Pasteuria penetrans TaxID=86005 RepID=UPI0011ED2DDC|nr:hypothetical protein [Pasteuria penetrans]
MPIQNPSLVSRSPYLPLLCPTEFQSDIARSNLRSSPYLKLCTQLDPSDLGLTHDHPFISNCALTGPGEPFNPSAPPSLQCFHQLLWTDSTSCTMFFGYLWLFHYAWPLSGVRTTDPQVSYKRLERTNYDPHRLYRLLNTQLP